MTLRSGWIGRKKQLEDQASHDADGVGDQVLPRKDAAEQVSVLTIDTFPLNGTGGAPPGALWLPIKTVGPMLTTIT